MINNVVLFFLIIYHILLFIVSLDLVNIGPMSCYYELKWRYIKRKTKETEHTWGGWFMIDGGMRQIRFCKNCGKMDIR